MALAGLQCLLYAVALVGYATFGKMCGVFLEDKIRQLCAKVVDTDDPLELETSTRKLQQAIHQHVADILEKAHARAIAQIQPLQGTSEDLSSNAPKIVHNDAAKGPQV